MSTDISDQDRYQDKRRHLLQKWYQIDWMIHILRDIEEYTSDEWVDEDECGSMHRESIGRKSEKARKNPTDRWDFYLFYR
jgi:hypothetical protein